MPEINQLCLFHADRLKFDQLERELKQLKWIPRSNCHRLASAVCSCRKNIDWESSQDKLRSHSMQLRAILASEEHSISACLATLLGTVLDSVTLTDFSRCRLLEILFLAQHGDFSFLSRGAISKNDRESTPTNNAKKTVQNLTQKQFDCMMRKKKKQYESEVVQLPMFPGNIKKLETKLGSGLVSYSKKERFIYEMKHQLNNRSFNDNVNATYIEMWSKNRGAIKSIKHCLKEKASEAQRLAEVQKKNRKAIKEQRRAYLQSCYDEDYEIYDEGILRKDRLSKTFGLKLKQDKHTGRRQGPAKESVECFQCLRKFSGLSNTTYPHCIYHPGYIVGDGVWSCCGSFVENYDDIEDEHFKTGCVEKKFHELEPYPSTKKRRPGKVKESVLSGGHCYRCHRAFAGLRNTTYPPCVHHPGYIVHDKWSCCGSTVQKGTDLESEHRTGCEEVKVHNFKPHKRANRKPQRDMLQRIKRRS